MSPGEARGGHPYPAVVLGLSATGMGVIRSLARLGVEVHGVYHDPEAELARHSNRLHARYRLHDHQSDDELLSILRTIQRRAGYPDRVVLIPTSDRFASFLGEWQGELQESFLFRVPTASIQNAFLNKRASADLCHRHQIPIPRTCAPDVLQDVQREASTYRYPVIVKPATSGVPGFPGKNVVVDGPEELVDFYRSRPDLITQSVFQELVDSGDGHILYVSTYSGADGTVLARSSFRKLRQWLPDRGVTSYGVTEMLPDLVELTTTFLDEIGYVGFTGVEFAEDTRTGETYFLELNARAVLPNRLMADAGVDLTAIAYLEMCGAAIPQGLIQLDGVYWIDFLHDIPSGAMRWTQGELGVRDWIRDAWRATSFASWDRHDPKPFLASLARLGAVGLGLSYGKQAKSIRSLRKVR